MILFLLQQQGRLAAANTGSCEKIRCRSSSFVKTKWLFLHADGGGAALTIFLDGKYALFLNNCGKNNNPDYFIY